MVRFAVRLPVLILILATAAFGQTQWTGSNGSLWDDPLNWDAGVPDGATDATILASAGTFPSTYSSDPACNDLTLEAGASMTLAAGPGDLTVNGNLVLGDGASLDAGLGTVAVGGDVSLGDGTATWILGSLTHTVAGDWASAGGSATGTGTIEFTGGGDLDTSTGSIPGVLSSAGIRLCHQVNVDTDMDVTGGNLRINNDALVAIGNDLTVGAGAVLEWSPVGSGADDVLDVDGSAVIDGSSGFSGPKTVFRVAGDYTAGASFNPAFGVVELDGGTTSTANGTLSFPSLRIVSGDKTLDAAAAVTADLTVDSGATLQTLGPVTVGGDVSLGDGSAAWAAGALTHQIVGDLLSSDASVTGGATLNFTGDGLLGTAAGALDAVSVTGGNRSVLDVQVLGDLSLSGGTLDIQNNRTLTVDGDLALTGGTLTFSNITLGEELIDVAGDVTMTCTAGTMTGSSAIACAGNWSANGTWQPGAGVVRLDGTGLTQLTGLGGDLTTAFFELRILNGIREAANNLVLDINSMDIAAGGELRVGDRTVTVPGSTIAVTGRLDVDAGGALALGSTAVVDINPAGRLSLLGSAGNPAAIVGQSGGGYDFDIRGTIEARHYRFSGMGVDGIQIGNTTTIDPVNDMSVGLFDDPSGDAGSTMLTISRPVPTEFRYVDFGDIGGAGTFNVTPLLGSAPLTFVNSEGGLSGEAFDNDPFLLATWTDDVTGIVDMFATAGLLQVVVDWETFQEVDSADFILKRGPTFGGPFVTIDTQAAVGPTSYTYTDTDVEAAQFYVYQLFEVLTHGAERFIAQRTATPFGPDLPANVLDVGPTGTYPDIQSALDSIATLNPVVMVAPGTYPPFTVTPGFLGTLRIYGDGAGPVIIDTTAGPAVIRDLSSFSAFELANMQIGSSTTSTAGLVVQDCQGLVIIDNCTVQGGDGGGGQPGIDLVASDAVALQNTDTAGTPGLLLQTDSTAILHGGSADLIDVRDSSFVRTAGTTFTQSVEIGSSLLDYGSPHANVTLPKFVPVGAPSAITFDGFPDSNWGIFFSFDIGWLDLYSAGEIANEMVPLADVGIGNLLVVLTLGPSGSLTIPFSLPPDGTILGIPIVIEMLNENPNNGNIRWSNAATMIGMPQ